MGWKWLEKPSQPATWGFVVRIVVKAAALFVLANLIFAALDPMETLGRVTLYNGVLPGRERLPYGENPAQSYNLSLNNIPAMFASHHLSQPKAADEYRVLLIGDSATWGWLLENRDTLAGQINAGDNRTDDGRRVVAYNVGYPIMSLTKDLMLLDEAMRYQPDMIVWLVTLESFPRSKQLFPPLLQNNPERVLALIERYGLDLDPADARFVEWDLWARTLLGNRRALADWLRLQTYGFSWAATGIDQYIPDEYTPRRSDFDTDVSWADWGEPAELGEAELAFDVLAAGLERAGDVLILIVNEPMFISEGQNSDLRYNAFYPRWAYDQYRELIAMWAEHENWDYIDLWNLVDADVFTDSPVHMTPEGVAVVVARLVEEILLSPR